MTMVDWSRQFQEAIKNWTEVQEKTRERWAEAARSLSNSDAGSQWQEEAAKVLDAWEESVKATTEFPLEQAREWPERLHSTARVLAGVQKQLLETWFASLRNLTPTEREGNWENVFET